MYIRFRPFYVKTDVCIYMCVTKCTEPGSNAKTFTRGYCGVGSESRDCGHSFFFNTDLSTYLPIPGPRDTAGNNPGSTGCTRAQRAGSLVCCRAPGRVGTQVCVE